MKTILFLEQFPNISGGQKVLLNIISGLDRAEFTPIVGLPEEGELSKELKGIGVEYIVLPVGSYSAGRKTFVDIVKYLFNSLFLVPEITKVVREKSADIIYANGPRVFIPASIAGMITRKRVIWHIHSILKGMDLLLCALFAQMHVSRIIAVSEAAREPFFRVFPSLKEKTEVIYNGIDAAPYQKEFNKKAVRTAVGLPENGPVIGYIGQIVRWKGVEELINAFIAVSKDIPDAHLVLIGDVVFGKSDAFKQHLAGMIKANGLDNRVLFLGRRDDVPELLSIIDLLAIPSIEPDPCPLVLLEGMAAGKAIVASKHGGVAEIIQDGIDGMLYPPKDITGLTEQLLSLCKDKDRRKRLGEKAREKVSLKHEIMAFQERIISAMKGAAA